MFCTTQHQKGPIEEMNVFMENQTVLNPRRSKSIDNAKIISHMMQGEMFLMYITVLLKETRGWKNN